MRVGLVGGTFDPIHLGHLAAAEAARRCARLDLVILMPAARPPHRPGATASAEDRLEMCRLAAAGRPGMEVSDLEIRRAGPSYTADTLAELHAARPGDQLFLVLGWDAAREIGSWQRPDRLLALAELVVVARPGLPHPSEADLAALGLPASRVLVCSERTPDVEATEIRRLAAARQPLDNLLPVPVAEYVERRGLYRSYGS